MRALITRPQEDSAALAEALSARGIEPQIEPLLTVKPVADAVVDLDGVQAVLFTSANGVRAFAALTPRRDLPAYTVGDGSAAAAKAAGFNQVESAGGDVSALASLVCDRLQPQDGILFHAAGSVTAGDLAGELEKAGFKVRRTALYSAEPTTALSPEVRMNLTLGGIDLVLLFSPRTATTFAKLWREAGSPDLERVCALCLSAAVAREVGDLNWRDVFIADRPDLPSLLTLVDAELQRKDEAMSETSTAAAEAVQGGDSPNASGRGQRNDNGGSHNGRSMPEPPAYAAAMEPAASGGTVGRLIGTIVVAGLVAAAVTVTAPRWQGLIGLGGSTTGDADTVADLQQQLAQVQAQQGDFAAKSDLTAAVGQLQDQLARIKDQLAGLPQAASGAPASDGQGTNTGQVADTASAANLTPLNDKLAELEKSIADLQAKAKEQAAAAPAAPVPATPTPPDLSPEVSALKTENQALRDQISMLGSKLDALGGVDQRVTSLETQVAAAPAPVTARQQLGTAVVLGIGQLRAVMAGPQPFDSELAALKQLAAGDHKLAEGLGPIVAKLQPIAPTGAATLSQLQASLPATEIARSAEAELAADAGGNEGWWARMTHRLAEIVTVRPVGDDVSGDGPLERLARAESALKAGDLAKAVAELKGLQGEAARRAAPWLAGAQARLDVDEAGANLAELATRELAPAAAASDAGELPESGAPKPAAN